MSVAAATAMFPGANLRPRDVLLDGLRILRAAIGASSGRIANAATSARGESQIDLLRRKDKDAWGTFFATEMPAIYRYAMSRLGGSHEAEDVASHVFEEAWENAHTLQDRGLPPRAWLFGIAKHVVASHHRSWLRRPPILALDSFDRAAPDPGLDPELMDLAHSLAKLDRSYAEVISLRFINSLSLQETADVLGISVDAVKARQARALVRLRAILKPQDR